MPLESEGLKNLNPAITLVLRNNQTRPSLYTKWVYGAPPDTYVTDSYILYCETRKGITFHGALILLSNIQDGVNGDCTTLIQVNRLPDAQTWNWSDQYDSVCKGAKSQAKHFFEVTKTKDFNHCSSIPHLNWAVPSLLHTCDMGAGNCGDALKVLYIPHLFEFNRKRLKILQFLMLCPRDRALVNTLHVVSTPQTGLIFA